MNKNMINDLVRDIVCYYRISEPIINIDEVVKVLGGKVEKRPEYISSFIRKEKDSFIICIPSLRLEEVQKFMIAQELGFLFLEMRYKINSGIWRKLKDTVYENHNENTIIAANEFAYSLLMPRSLYLEQINKNKRDGKVDIRDIAKYFGVSASIAAQRGINLGVVAPKI